MTGEISKKLGNKNVLARLALAASLFAGSLALSGCSRELKINDSLGEQNCVGVLIERINSFSTFDVSPGWGAPVHFRYKSTNEQNPNNYSNMQYLLAYLVPGRGSKGEQTDGHPHYENMDDFEYTANINDYKGYAQFVLYDFQNNKPELTKTGGIPASVPHIDCPIENFAGVASMTVQGSSGGPGQVGSFSN